MQLRLPFVPLVLAVLTTGLAFAQTTPEVYIPFQLPSRTANRIMEQATWGPTQTESLVLQKKGFEAWFKSQLAAPISTYADQAYYNSVGNNNTNLQPVQAQFFQNALSGPDQLRQRVAFTLSKIWVVSESELNNASAFPPYMRLLQADAFANYEQIMTDVTLNPAMGRYLNMANNNKGNPVAGTSPNENYAREIMQLFTLGLNELNVDGSPFVDSHGVPVPAYTETTVLALARAFTGWTYAPAPGTPSQSHNPVSYLLPMVPTEANHDMNLKVIFPGYTLPAGQSAELDLKQAIHAIFMQSSLPPFISHQLILSLTTSNPSPAYVQRISEVFINNGQGVRGDMQAIIHAILTDPEARAADDPNSLQSTIYGHMREPVLFALNLLRGLNGTLTSSTNAANQVASLGQQLFYAPSVFSYFSPFYRTSNGLVAPEMQVYSTQSSSNRINIVNSAIYGGQLDSNTKFDISAFVSAAAVPANLITKIDTVFFHGAMSDSLKTAITQSMNAVTVPSDKAKAALYIALSSAEYQIID